MATPIEKRIEAVDSAPKPHIVSSGTDAYRSLLKGNASAFAEWRRNPMTKAVLSAIQDAILHVPSTTNAESAEAQLGVTQGLVYAMYLVADPSGIWPGVFGNDTGLKTGGVPVMDFTGDLDYVFGVTSEM